MGKYLGLFLVGFLLAGAVVLGIAFAASGTLSVSTWLLAILLALIVGAMCFAVSVRKDGH